MKLREYVYADMEFYYNQSRKERLMYWLINDPIHYIAKYLRYLRKEEYYSASSKRFAKILSLYYFRKKNKLGNKLGFKIPRNCFGPRLTIYHHGEIIVNEKTRIGTNCKLHGGNCIGNNGMTDKVPQIGNDLDLGIGAKIIGGVSLGNGVKIGANAVVTKSFNEDDITLVGIPAKKLSSREV